MPKSVIERSRNACAEHNEVPILQFVYHLVSASAGSKLPSKQLRKKNTIIKTSG